MASQQFNLNCIATTNANLINNIKSRVSTMVLNNASAAAKWVRLYDKATAPTPGTDTPIIIINIPASSTVVVPPSLDLQFVNGLGIAITGAAPVLDATAVAAGDVQVAIVYNCAT
jgi:hypothetical protein